MHPKEEKAFFNSRGLPKPKNRFVAWIDLMGTRSTMLVSLSKSSNFIGKFYDAVIKSQPNESHLFALMDGAFIVSDSWKELETFLRDILMRLGKTFADEPNANEAFIPKVSISFGPTMFGDDVDPIANSLVKWNDSIKKGLVFGIPIIQAYESETLAPPFGIYLHDSVRVFGGEFNPDIWFKWCDDTELRNEIMKQLNAYFEYWEKHGNLVLYKLESIKRHKAAATQYWS